MLEIPVSSVKLDKKSGFDKSQIQKPQMRLIIKHIVEMSKKKGEWIYDFSMDEFLEDFKPNPMSFPCTTSIWNYMMELQLDGYIKFNAQVKTIHITKRFENLCKEFSTSNKKNI